MSCAGADFAALKNRLRQVWMAGDFGQIARLTTHAAEEFVARLKLRPGVKLLDVACGTGNVSLPAARAGASVTGVDIAPNLLEQARARAVEEKLPIQFDEGDAEQLPYGDGSFDYVVTMFGAMFAPRPERVAAELVRVCRAGATIAMANWRADGFAGKQFALMSRYAPPPAGIPAPVLWGDPELVRQRFADRVSDLSFSQQSFRWLFPFSPEEAVELFRRYFGPTQATFARLDAAQQQALKDELVRLWIEENRARDGTTEVEMRYLEVRARKRAK